MKKASHSEITRAVEVLEVVAGKESSAVIKKIVFHLLPDRLHSSQSIQWQIKNAAINFLDVPHMQQLLKIEINCKKIHGGHMFLLNMRSSPQVVFI